MCSHGKFFGMIKIHVHALQMQIYADGSATVFESIWTYLLCVLQIVIWRSICKQDSMLGFVEVSSVVLEWNRQASLDIHTNFSRWLTFNCFPKRLACCTSFVLSSSSLITACPQYRSCNWCILHSKGTIWEQDKRARHTILAVDVPLGIPKLIRKCFSWTLSSLFTSAAVTFQTWHPYNALGTPDVRTCVWRDSWKNIKEAEKWMQHIIDFKSVSM